MKKLPDNLNNGLRCRPGFGFALLVLIHFTVDFYGGLLNPILEPTLTSHFGLDIGRIAALVGGWALLINIVQPVSGWLLPKHGMPILLLLAPPAAAGAALIGLTTQLHGAIILLAISGVGIGLVHPEATLAVHSLNSRRAGAAVGLFMAAGYFGFAGSGVVAGVWAELRGLSGLWILALPAFMISGLGMISGLHRLKGHVNGGNDQPETEVGLPWLLILATGLATIMCLLVRFTTVLLVRRFPEAAGQGWGGTTVFATGVTGAVGAFLWGALADRKGTMPVLCGLQLAAIPFLFLLLRTPLIELAPLWGLCLGGTIGSAFPLAVVRARRTHGLSPRMRMGLVIGGAWGTGETVFIIAGNYLNRFPVNDPDPVTRILLLCVIILIVNAGLAFHMIKTSKPRRPAVDQPGAG